MALQQVRAQVNGTWYLLTLNTLTGKYEKTITAPAVTSYKLEGGYYPVTIEASDDSGNVTTDTSGRLIVKETTEPSILILSPTSDAVVTNNQQKIRFRVFEEENDSGINLSTLEFSIDYGVAISANAPGMVCTPAANGYICEYTPQSAFGDGNHVISVYVEDNDGNVSGKAVTFKVDTTPPSLNILTPPEGLKTNQDTVTVSGVTNDATTSPVTIEIEVNGTFPCKVTVNSDGSFSAAVPVVVGENTITVWATDQAEQSTKITRTVFVNKTAPVISNIGATPNPVNTGESVLISVTVTDDK